MTELIARREDPPAPLTMPVLLSFVAYVITLVSLG